jgi:hypothetical protein
MRETERRDEGPNAGRGGREFKKKRRGKKMGKDKRKQGSMN